MLDLVMPTSILEHENDFIPGKWKDYTLTELGNWVHLFVKRARHRVGREKAKKDLKSAQCYLDIMQAHIDAANKLARIK